MEWKICVAPSVLIVIGFLSNAASGAARDGFDPQVTAANTTDLVFRCSMEGFTDTIANFRGLNISKVLDNTSTPWLLAVLAIVEQFFPPREGVMLSLFNSHAQVKGQYIGGNFSGSFVELVLTDMWPRDIAHGLYTCTASYDRHAADSSPTNWSTNLKLLRDFNPQSTGPNFNVTKHAGFTLSCRHDLSSSGSGWYNISITRLRNNRSSQVLAWKAASVTSGNCASKEEHDLTCWSFKGSSFTELHVHLFYTSWQAGELFQCRVERQGSGPYIKNFTLEEECAETNDSRGCNTNEHVKDKTTEHVNDKTRSDAIYWKTVAIVLASILAVYIIVTVVYKFRTRCPCVNNGTPGGGGGGQNADSGNQSEPQGKEQPLPEPKQQNRNSSDNCNEAEEGNGARLSEGEYNEDDRLVNTRTNQTS